MIQSTSLDAYFTKVKPRLTQMQAEVYQVFKGGYDLTNMEAAQILGWSINRVTPRVLELRRKGVLACATRRRCSVTNNSAYAWKVTGR